jgi:hypothetical protein
MPHHSAHQQQINALAQQQSAMMGGNPSFPPPRSYAVTPRGMDFRGMVPMQHPPLASSPQPHSPWMSRQQPPMIHRVDLHTDSHTEGEHSASTRRREGGSSSTASRSLHQDDSKSFDSTHDVAASVLLLAAGALKSEEMNRKHQEVDEESSDRSGPLKKRKKVADIMRTTDPETPTRPFHVSPVSQAGKTPNTATTPGTLASDSSYDLKDAKGQALLDSAKINDTKEISISHVEIPHFPSVLHAVLTESEFAGKVLQWLPHGQAWRIVRWDALRKQVLPKYFTQLKEEDTASASGSIDAFLWHLSAWGMEEITDGPDVGAYSHVVRIETLFETR